MKNYIPKYFINHLLNQIDILDLIEKKLKIKKNGNNYVCLCPFHNEKTPSFTINREKKYFYCFGCTISGNIIDFLMKYENLTFIESIKELSFIYNIKIPYNDKYNIEINKKNIFYEILDKINIFFKLSIRKFKNKHILKYLINRGLTIETIKMFDIGFSDSINMNDFIIMNNYKYNNSILIDSGILTKSYYNIFYNRIIFPIKNHIGQIIAFGGRTIYKKYIKYINSPETVIFSKRNNLYGLYNINKNNLKFEKILLVEGYMDVIFLYQFDIKYCVSTLGNKVSDYQIKLLFKFTNNIICCYDGDNAGYLGTCNFMKKSLIYLKNGFHIYFILLPNNEDPETLIKKEGKKNFEIRVNSALSLFKFINIYVHKNINLNLKDNNMSLYESIYSLISKIPCEIYKIYLNQLLNSKFGITNFVFFKNSNLHIIKKIKINKKINIKITTMKILIALIIQNPYLFKKVKKINNINFLINKIPGLSLFYNIIDTCSKIHNISTGVLIEHYRNDKNYKYIKILSFWNHMFNKDEINNKFDITLKELNNKLIKQKIDSLINYDKIYGLNIKQKRKLWSMQLFLNKI